MEPSETGDRKKWMLLRGHITALTVEKTNDRWPCNIVGTELEEAIRSRKVHSESVWISRNKSMFMWQDLAKDSVLLARKAVMYC